MDDNLGLENKDLGFENKKSDIDLTEFDLTDIDEYSDKEDFRGDYAEINEQIQQDVPQNEEFGYEQTEPVPETVEVEQSEVTVPEEQDDIILPAQDEAQDDVIDNKIEEGFEKFSSILNIGSNEEETDEDNKTEETDFEADELFADYKSEEPSSKNRGASVICTLLIVAFVICAGFAAYTYFKPAKLSETASNIDKIGCSPEFSPYKDLKPVYPVSHNEENINSELAPLYSINSNTVGWLSIDSTAVDYPIVQSMNNSTYLNFRNFYNQTAVYGTPFIDYRCEKNTLSKNTVIYGHHMNNGLHFGSLDGYKSSVYYKEHPFISYQTLNGNYTFKVYAVFYATTQAECDGGYIFDYYNPNMSDTNFSGYIEMLKQYALYTTDAGLESTDKIITLSTCSHIYDDLRPAGVDARLVVVGRLLREGEKAIKENLKTEENDEYRRPQIWYDVKEEKNPYASSRVWKPSIY